MIRFHQRLLLALGLALAAPLTGQTVVTEAKLDSVQVELRDALYRLRDTLTIVEGATARISRDIGTTSDQVLRSRAQAIADGCTLAASVLVSTRTLIGERARPNPDVRQSRTRLVAALDTLEAKLARCRTDWKDLATTARSKELRDYGVRRGEQVRAAIREVDPVLGLYFTNAIGIRYLPKGGRKNLIP